ncbi:MAG: SUMF1/EgtB/PvdO family nonheme iron enzyme [Pseudomonadota bacterium]
MRWYIFLGTSLFLTMINCHVGGTADSDTAIDSTVDASFDTSGEDIGGRDADANVDIDGNVNTDAGASDPTWISIQSGTFLMGSNVNEPCRDEDEQQHEVTLTNSFEISATEVTQGQFQKTMGYNPSGFANCGQNCPVETVNWNEAAAYCNALSEEKGLGKCYDCKGQGAFAKCEGAASYSQEKIYKCPGYRLPTEAEWEYAYRAGTIKALYNGDIFACYSADANAQDIAWFSYNSGGVTHVVATQDPNAWGLYDMAGNVMEWCNDWYAFDYGSSSVTDPWGASTGVSKAERGGAWVYDAARVRAASRDSDFTKNSFNLLGFRCVRTK